ncbi:hypothetical protein DAEQUDRAFT_559670 [Daedalea quercina L-15889]|uniref:Integrase zinc-binding domain-containing protein n=1 Tax=Daedalea quercina L-15889 TaxID=1314783 RepID=A0A165M0J1_9APHY|nr:hypothetical protein DAEQUDRAFT_559670 [Daedalea quercina L-15889]
MSSQSRRSETRRSATSKFQPYALAYGDDEDEFLPSPRKKPSSRATVSRTSSAEKKKPKTTSEPLAPPTTNLGMPSREQYKAIEEEYIQSLHPRKREKALLSQAMFDMIWDVLHDPLRSRVSSPQFRWWVRKMFVLSHVRSELSPSGEPVLTGSAVDASTPVVLHEDRPVALKEQIYEVLCYCHDLSNHGGRDKTTMVIREHYSWIPKELVAQFVKVCPTCVYKKTGNRDLANALTDVGNSPVLKTEDEEGKYVDNLAGAQAPLFAYPHLPALPELPVLVKSKAAPSSDWPTVTLPSIHAPAPQAMPARARANALLVPPVDSWIPAAYTARGDWSSGSVPSHSDGHQDLPPIRRLHSADDAFAHNDNLRITLPPLQQVLSDGGFRANQPPVPSVWNAAPPLQMHAWDSGSPAWTVPPFSQPIVQTTAHSGFLFTSSSPLSSPSRNWYRIPGVDGHPRATGEHEQFAIDPALLAPDDDYFSFAPDSAMGFQADSPLRLLRERSPTPAAGDVLSETPRRGRHALSVQSLLAGSSSMASLTLDEGVGEGEEVQELTTPVRRAVAGVMENGRSPGGSVYLHPLRFSLSG